MRLLPPRGERALPVLAGVVLALAYPPVELLVPAFVGLVPLLVFIAERPAGPAGRWSATRAGLVTGTVYFGLQLYWLAVALLRYSALAIPAYLGTVLVLAGLTGVFGWTVHYTRERLGLSVAVLALLFWPGLEWVQAHLGDLSFPWLGLGTALAPFPRLAGAADLVGAQGLTVWVAAVNGLLAAAVLRHRAGRPVRPVLAGALLAVAGPAAYGVVRAATLELAPAARVAVVQPNIPEELKMDRRVAMDTSMAALTRLTRGLAGEPLDLVVWPEVALPTELRADGSAARTVRALSAAIDAPILVGAYGVDGTGDGRGAGAEATDPIRFNSAVLADAGGEPGPRYDKRRLVPFVERVPFIDPAWLEGVTGDLRYFGGLGRGRTGPVLRVEGSGFGTLICYESIFASLAREYRRQGADFLVNITNDAWYGGEEWYARTPALWQHPAHMVMRAIEGRVGVARAANTGISMLIDPLGRSHQQTPLFEPAVRVGTVYTTPGRTLYVRWGPWLTTLVVALAGAAVVAARLRPPPVGRGS